LRQQSGTQWNASLPVPARRFLGREKENEEKIEHEDEHEDEDEHEQIAPNKPQLPAVPLLDFWKGVS
jgi:hypothetical protein